MTINMLAYNLCKEQAHEIAGKIIDKFIYIKMSYDNPDIKIEDHHIISLLNELDRVVTSILKAENK